VNKATRTTREALKATKARICDNYYKPALMVI